MVTDGADAVSTNQIAGLVCSYREWETIPLCGVYFYIKMTLTWGFGTNSALKPLWWLDQVDFTVLQYRHLTTCQHVLPNEVHLRPGRKPFIVASWEEAQCFLSFTSRIYSRANMFLLFEHALQNRVDKPENNTFVISGWNWCLWNHNNDALRLSARLFLTGTLQKLHNSVPDQWGSSTNVRSSKQKLCCAWVSLSGG